MTSKDVIKVLRKLGWYEVNQVGSHKQFKHDKIKVGLHCHIPK